MVNGMATNLIIILVLILIILLIIIGVYLYIRNKVRNISQQIFNTPNIMEGFKKQELEYQSTPKSLSSLDSVLMPKILKDFPNLNIDEIKKMAENSVMTYYNGLNNKKIKEKYYMSEHFLKLIQEEMVNVENSDISYKNIKIHRTVINAYDNKKGSCIITFQSAVEYYKGKKDKEVRTQVRVNTEMIYIYDDTKVEDTYGVSLNCHNCGAPIKMLGIKTCPYCGTGIVDYVSKTWKVNNIYEK